MKCRHSNTLPCYKQVEKEVERKCSKSTSRRITANEKVDLRNRIVWLYQIMLSDHASFLGIYYANEDMQVV